MWTKTQNREAASRDLRSQLACRCQNIVVKTRESQQNGVIATYLSATNVSRSGARERILVAHQAFDGAKERMMMLRLKPELPMSDLFISSTSSNRNGQSLYFSWLYLLALSVSFVS